MNYKLIVSALSIVVATTSCIAPRVYKDLETRHDALKQENQSLMDKNSELSTAKTQLEDELAELQKNYNETLEQRDRLQNDFDALQSNHQHLQDSYDALEKNSSESIAKNVQQNRDLLAQLEAKEQALAAENSRLEALQRELQSRSDRVAELERVIAQKDAAMLALKDAISRALTDFEGQGLTVEHRDGKVYISMENKLLFSSGSWAIGAAGRRAVEQLGSVLSVNPDIAVLIEGHTDNVPYKGNGQLSGNWDLSTKRATAIVNILRENNEINPESLTAAGRGEFAPVASNSTAEGRAKNRRIEVILTPKLDEISKLLNDL